MITRTATLEKVAQTDAIGFCGTYDINVDHFLLSELNFSFCQKQVLLEGLQPHSCFILKRRSLSGQTVVKWSAWTEEREEMTIINSRIKLLYRK